MLTHIVRGAGASLMAPGRAEDVEAVACKRAHRSFPRVISTGERWGQRPTLPGAKTHRARGRRDLAAWRLLCRPCSEARRREVGTL